MVKKDNVKHKAEKKSSCCSTEIDKLDKLAEDITKLRKNPLLVMYYPDIHGHMTGSDAKDVYNVFRTRGWKKQKPNGSLDVLIHTYGGVASVGYTVAQVIRDFASRATFLVPESAFSGGTLLCLSGNNIRLGDYAQLSPIDITIHAPRKNGAQITELVAIDYYMQFAQECRERIENMLKELHDDKALNGYTRVESDLLVELVKQVGAIQLGTFYRNRRYTEKYALKLMKDYMFSDRLDKEDIANKIVQKLLFEYPSHSFFMDYHICYELGLPVEEMTEEESDKTKELVDNLRGLAKSAQICKSVNEGHKIPFFSLYEL